ncbi:M81 family metallopeptidase [Phaeobacter sp.]|uniref:M81 family metallopeptidase n=1 Tax=Phaeobacter sp. TaxID=1902409 RepID=UPI0025EB74A5|nr:M81 family metallopeptidase [Phaeobacter sp.]
MMDTVAGIMTGTVSETVESAKPRPVIAVAGFQHETNCFGGENATLADFQMADSWPEMLFGDQVIAQTKGLNLPIAGFVAAAETAGLQVKPILWCAAEPSAEVTDHAFDTIANMILDGIKEAEPLDGIYLDLHGAMVTERFADGEGELLRRIRAQVGPEIPIVISLDLHANISGDMVAQTHYIGIFRTYPHLDMAATGARCAPVLAQLLKGAPLCKAHTAVPYLIPLHAQFTGAPPFDAIYALPGQMETDGILAEIALGFTAADFPDTGPACLAYAPTQQAADAAADHMLQCFLRAEADIDSAMLTPEAAAKKAHEHHGAPLVLADVQDNPGAGGSSDSTGLLRALINQGSTDVLMGLMNDADAAAQAHAAGVGQVIHLALGGKSGPANSHPVAAEFEVLALSDGTCRYSGEMYGGGIATLGPTAALRLHGADAEIDIVVTSQRNQCLDLAHFTHIGLDPKQYRCICVKSTVHFRAAFDPIAGEIVPVAAPGLFVCDLEQLPYRNLGAKRLPKHSDDQTDNR